MGPAVPSPPPSLFLQPQGTDGRFPVGEAGLSHPSRPPRGAPGPGQAWMRRLTPPCLLLSFLATLRGILVPQPGTLFCLTFIYLAEPSLGCSFGISCCDL